MLTYVAAVVATFIGFAGFWRFFMVPAKRERTQQIEVLAERVAALSAENSRLLNMVEFDDLTAARSRRYMRELFSRRRQDGCNAMVFLDLDEFKSVNDGFGHRAGDALLRRIAEALLSNCREREILFRHGGDEFCIYMEQVEMCEVMERAHDFVRLIAATSVDVDGFNVRRTASAGVTRIDAGQDLIGALYYADEALYAAKHSGGNAVRATEGETLKSFIARRTAPRAEDVAEAVRKDEITYYVQPIFDTSVGRAIGAEALIRWVRNDGDVLLPEKFIDVMRRNHHADLKPSAEASAAVLRQLTENCPDIFCSFNISSSFLKQPYSENEAMVAQLTKGLSPRNIVFELVESAAIENPAATRDMLDHMRDIGVRIALDDFGTGFSNLERLTSLNVDIVKIDKSFVRDYGTAKRDPGILRALYDMSLSMGFSIIAEGVETERELAALQEIGIFNAQGYLLGRPETVGYWKRRIGAALPTTFRAPQSA